jgi:hypothetical protein
MSKGNEVQISDIDTLGGLSWSRTGSRLELKYAVLQVEFQAFKY